MSTPSERLLKKKLKEMDATKKMDKDLAKYGRKVQGGMVWTVGDMQRYFAKKRRRKK